MTGELMKWIIRGCQLLCAIILFVDAYNKVVDPVLINIAGAMAWLAIIHVSLKENW